MHVAFTGDTGIDSGITMQLNSYDTLQMMLVVSRLTDLHPDRTGLKRTYTRVLQKGALQGNLLVLN